MNSVRGLPPPLHRAMAFCLQLPVDCYNVPTRPDRGGYLIASRLGVDPQLEKLAAPTGSRLPHLAAWTEDFVVSGKGMPYDEFTQFYKVYAALNPDRAQVPPEYLEEYQQRRLEEFKQRRAAVKIQGWYRGARSRREPAPPPASRPPPPDPPAPSPPPPGSTAEPAASTAEARTRRRPNLSP